MFRKIRPIAALTALTLFCHWPLSAVVSDVVVLPTLSVTDQLSFNANATTTIRTKSGPTEAGAWYNLAQQTVGLAVNDEIPVGLAPPPPCAG